MDADLPITIIDLDVVAKRAIRSSRDASTPEYRFTQGDTVRLRLRGWEPVPAEEAGFDLYRPKKIEFAELAAGILKVDEPPTGGTWKIRVGDDPDDLTTAELAYNISKAELAVKLNALANVTSAGGVKVVDGGRANIYRVLWNTPANILPMAVVEKKLTPFCFARVTVDSSTAGKVLLKIFQAPYAFADDFVLPTPPAVTVETVVQGSVTQNEVQRIRIPDQASGKFAFTTHGRGLIAVASATSAGIASTLNEPYVSALASDVRFAVTNPKSGVFDIEFIGEFAASNQTTLAVEMFDQGALDTPEAEFALTGVAIEDALDGAGEVRLIFEIVATNANGKETTLCHLPCVVVNDGIDAAMATDTPNWLQSAEDAQQAEGDEETPVISGFLSWRGTLGDAEDVDGSRIWNVEHELGTVDPLPILYHTATRRRLKPYVEYDAEAVDANHVKLEFPAAVVPGDISVTIVSFEAQTVLNLHRHTTDVIDGVGDYDGQTLTQILDEIVTAMPDGWPVVPGAAIADESLLASKLNLESLIAALAASPTFLALLRTLVGDPTVVSNIIQQLSTNTLLRPILNTLITNILTVVGGDTVLQDKLLDVLQAIPDFVSWIRELALESLMTGAQPNGLLMVVPDFEKTVPTLDHFTMAGVNTVLYKPLPIALPTTTSGSTITGDLPASGTTAQRRVVVTSARSLDFEGRQAKTFLNDEVVAWNGRFWQGIVQGGSGSTWYPSEMEMELLLVFAHEKQLCAGSILVVSFTPNYQLAGEVQGRAALVFEFGAAAADAGDLNLSGLTWTVALEMPILLGPALTVQPFRVAVTRAANGTLTASLDAFTEAYSLTPPGSANFAFRVRLAKFDVANVTNPHGALTVRVKGAAASIAKLLT